MTLSLRCFDLLPHFHSHTQIRQDPKSNQVCSDTRYNVTQQQHGNFPYYRCHHYLIVRTISCISLPKNIFWDTFRGGMYKIFALCTKISDPQIQAPPPTPTGIQLTNVFSPPLDTMCVLSLGYPRCERLYPK
jgi:hypothetical protein